MKSLSACSFSCTKSLPGDLTGTLILAISFFVSQNMMPLPLMHFKSSSYGLPRHRSNGRELCLFCKDEGGDVVMKAMEPHSAHSSEPEQNEISRELKLLGVPKNMSSTELMWDLGQIHAASTSKTGCFSVAFATNYEVLTENPHEEVCTDLKLSHESCNIPRKRRTMESSARNAKEKNSVTDSPTATISRSVSSRPERKGVRCTIDDHEGKTLSLEDPWNIKKRLTCSDLGHLSRLMVQTKLVKDHILPFLGTDLIREVESNGMLVTVWDKDSESEHLLVFKRWATSKSYVFIGMWNKDFVIRRDLKQGDVIGIHWDYNKSRFNFCVLERARLFQSLREFQQLIPKEHSSKKHKDVLSSFFSSPKRV